MPTSESPKPLHSLVKQPLCTPLHLRRLHLMAPHATSYNHTDHSPRRAAKKHAETTDAYKVDIDKFPTAKENLKISTFPAVIVFKDGVEIKRVEGINKENAQEIAAILV